MRNGESSVTQSLGWGMNNPKLWMNSEPWVLSWSEVFEKIKWGIWRQCWKVFHRSALTYNSSIPLRQDQLFSWTLKSFLPQLFMRPSCGGGFTDSWTRFPGTKLITSPRVANLKFSWWCWNQLLLVLSSAHMRSCLSFSHLQLLCKSLLLHFSPLMWRLNKPYFCTSCLLQLCLCFVSFSEHPQLVQLIKLI